MQPLASHSLTVQRQPLGMPNPHKSENQTWSPSLKRVLAAECMGTLPVTESLPGWQLPRRGDCQECVRVVHGSFALTLDFNPLPSKNACLVVFPTGQTTVAHSLCLTQPMAPTRHIDREGCGAQCLQRPTQLNGKQSHNLGHNELAGDSPTSSALHHGQVGSHASGTAGSGRAGRDSTVKQPVASSHVWAWVLLLAATPREGTGTPPSESSLESSAGLSDSIARMLSTRASACRRCSSVMSWKRAGAAGGAGG